MSLRGQGRCAWRDLAPLHEVRGKVRVARGKTRGRAVQSSRHPHRLCGACIENCAVRASRLRDAPDVHGASVGWQREETSGVVGGLARWQGSCLQACRPSPLAAATRRSQPVPSAPVSRGIWGRPRLWLRAYAAQLGSSMDLHIPRRCSCWPKRPWMLSCTSGTRGRPSGSH